MTSLSELIREKAIHLSNCEIPKQNERAFMEDFLKQYAFNNISSYKNVSNVAYFMAVLISNNINMDFEDLVENIQIIEEFINELDFDINVYNDYLKDLEQLSDLGILKQIINKQKILFLDKNSKKIYKSYLANKEKLLVSDNNVYNEETVDAFNKLFFALPQPQKFQSFIYFGVVVEEINSKVQDILNEALGEAINDDIFSEDEKATFKGRKFNRIINKSMKKAFVDEVKNLLNESEGLMLKEDYNLMRNWYEITTKEVKDIVKDANKKIRSLEDLEYKLKYINPERIIKIDDNTRNLLFDSEIRYHYLYLTNIHNYNLYKKEEEKNIEFNNNSLTKLEILFSKYGFNFNDFNEEEKNDIINKVNVSHVENILNSVKYSELLFISDYIGEFAKIIISSKLEIIKFIDTLLKNKIIDKKFVLKHIEVLYNMEIFNNLFNNVNYLNSIGINLNNLAKDDSEILLLNNEEIITKTNVLSEYSLNLDSEDIYNFEVLKNDKMLDLLDNFIELGLKDIVLENPRYLQNAGFDIVKRIIICNLIGVNPINKYHKIVGAVSTGNNFYVGPKDYDNFIIDYKQDYQNPICLKVLEENKKNIISPSTKSRVFIKKLDELYRKDELTYVIDGVIISRNRVMRNLEVLLKHLSNSDIDIKDLVYQAILYKMINNIEPDTLELIYNSVCSIQLESNKTYTLK